MTTPKQSIHLHPILKALDLCLPMKAETSWTLEELSEPGTLPLCRITMADGGDLFLETDDNGAIARYGFDDQGNLVSLHHQAHFEGALFAELKQDILKLIRKRLQDSGIAG
jgi:YD repeat-containing protein